MRTHYNPKNNPRVIIIQKLYGKFYNEDDDLDFPKHRFKKFIKDIVLGTIERNDLIWVTVGQQSCCSPAVTPQYHWQSSRRSPRRRRHPSWRFCSLAVTVRQAVRHRHGAAQL